MGGSLTMSFMKFSKGKKIYSVPNGLGDGSAYFDDSSDTCTILKYPLGLPSGNSARTISFWLWQYDDSYGDTLFGYGTDSNASWIYIYVSNGKLGKSGYYLDYTSSVEIAFKKWQHVVFTYDGVSSNKFYLNGVLAETFEQGGYNTVEKEGYTRIACGADDKQTHCNLKDINVYNRALTADEVTTLYNKGTVTDGLVLNVPLTYGKDDDSLFSSKSFIYDYSTLTTSSGFDEFGYPIRYDIASECGINYATIPTDNLILYMALKENRTSPEIVDSDVFSTSYEGNYNSANYQVVDNVPCLYIDSSSNITLTRGNKEIRQATFAYFGKFKDSSQCIITNSYDESACVNGGAEFWLAFGATGAYFTSGNHKGNIITANMSISPEWHHIAVTWDMDTNYMYLYLDGVLIGECTDQSWLAPNINRSGFILSVNNLYRASSVVYGNGYYSNVRMYDRVLKASEIKALAREF